MNQRNNLSGSPTILCLFVLTATLWGVTASGVEVQQQDDPVLTAMRDEMARTMEKLRLEDLEKPYFVAYTLTDSQSAATSASFGSLIESSERSQRRLHVEVRVGDYTLDNTNFLQTRLGSRPSRAQNLPLDGDYKEIRRQLWLATDRAYKEALEVFAKKKAALKNVTRSDDLPDFSPKEIAQHWEEQKAPVWDLGKAEGLVTRLSGLFRESPGLHTSRVYWRASTSYVRYLDSEGTAFTQTRPHAGLETRASTQAPDGLELTDTASFYGGYPAELPSEETMAKEVRKLAESLVTLRTANLLERYNGPVLFDGRAAAEIFAQVLMPKLLAQRQPVAEDQRLAQALSMVNSGATDFQDRIGGRILPRFLRVVDNPLLQRADGSPEVASYTLDEQGAPARLTTLVERGYLKSLLAGRTPVPGAEASSGSFRAGGVTPSNVLVETSQGLSADELKQELLQLVADRDGEFGIVIRRIENPLIAQDRMSGRRMIIRLGASQAQAPNVVAAYKVYPDGREELLRNVELSGLTATTFKEIVAAGEETGTYRAPVQPVGRLPFSSMAQRAKPMASYRVPALLFEELTLKRPSGEIPKPPLAEHPYFAD